MLQITVERMITVVIIVGFYTAPGAMVMVKWWIFLSTPR